MEKRWLLRFAPPLVALGALGLLASASAGASGTAWEPPDCGSGAGPIAGPAAVPRPAAPERLGHEAWFRLDPVLDATGTLAGQRLEIGLQGGRARHLALPPESFAAGPFGRLVLVGTDDGSQSTLRAIDAAASCARLIARESSVIRRAVVDPAGTNVYEFRVDRRGRTDLGVWKRALAGGMAVRVLAALPGDPRFGLTFSTELTWSLDGDRLAIQQCGVTSCRTRLLDPASGRVATIARPDIGELVGVAGDRVVAYGACRGLPCPIVSVEASTSRTTVLAKAAGLARLISTDRGPRVIHESGPDAARQLRSTDLTGGSTTLLAAAPGDLRLVPASGRASAGVRLPDGWVLLAPGGRGTSGLLPILIRASDGLSLPLTEVTR